MIQRMLFRTAMTRAEAEEVIGSHVGQIGDCIRYGWGANQQMAMKDPDTCKAFGVRTRACMVHDLIVEKAKAIFRGAAGVMTYMEEGIFTVDFYGKLRLRFKKLNTDLRPHNIPTKQQQMFGQQTLFGPESTKVTAGYVLDRTELSIAAMHIVCWDNNEKLWNWPLPVVKAIALEPVDVSMDNAVIITSRIKKDESA
ncbi:hypothetical protein KAR91_43220 [Candidatus Pacearchaeota archaeon]|nr:hypothetical protein [Candidatus Pacearchaeota archaeon]